MKSRSLVRNHGRKGEQALGITSGRCCDDLRRQCLPAQCLISEYRKACTRTPSRTSTEFPVLNCPGWMFEKGLYGGATMTPPPFRLTIQTRSQNLCPSMSCLRCIWTRKLRLPSSSLPSVFEMACPGSTRICWCARYKFNAASMNVGFHGCP